ncbi:hypothetical protein ACF07T_39790 [Streptomyces sp. NPDC015184]
MPVILAGRVRFEWYRTADRARPTSTVTHLKSFETDATTRRLAPAGSA